MSSKHGGKSSHHDHRRRNQDERDHRDRRDHSSDRKRKSDDRNHQTRYDRKRRYSDEPENRHGNRKNHEKKTYEWGKNERRSPAPKAKEKEKPNFETTGKLTAESNSFRGVVIKYSEPPEARVPKRRWRLYPFKGEKALPVLHMHRQSGYLIGRDRKIADFAVDHPSCSKQHAAFQFRMVAVKTETGSSVQRIRPYIMDLVSANGTFLNNKKIEPRKYYELFEKDVLKFGFSSREYVLLHENSADDVEDDDVKNENSADDVEDDDVKNEDDDTVKTEASTP